MSEMIKVNPLPAPTWRWLRINDTEMRLPSEVTEALVEEVTPADGEISQPFTDEEYRLFNEMESGMGKSFADYMMAAPVDPIGWKTRQGETVKEPLVYRVYGTGTESTVNRFLFSAEKDSEVTIVMHLARDDFRSNETAGGTVPEDAAAGETASADTATEGTVPADATAEGTAPADAAAGAPVYAFMDTRIVVNAGAKVHLIQVCDVPEQISAAFDVGALVAEDGSLDVLQISLDGKKNYFGVAADLAGARAHFGQETAYRAGAGQHVDMNYVARHHGADTTCNMDLKGVLRDGASKSCRATIDFIRGCKGAKGDEREDVLLLGEDIVNKTIPLILCQEEDVEGAHGATIGDLSEEILWYFRSRGIDDETASELIATGRLLGSVRKIPEKELRDTILGSLGEEIYE